MRFPDRSRRANARRLSSRIRHNAGQPHYAERSHLLNGSSSEPGLITNAGQPQRAERSHRSIIRFTDARAELMNKQSISQRPAIYFRSHSWLAPPWCYYAGPE